MERSLKLVASWLPANNQIQRIMSRKVNEKCRFYFLGHCHAFLGGMCSGIKCGFKKEKEATL
uniref:Uncharacterized protein n=1 Tax=Myoviridae sp. ctkmZ20 TaxID=2825166 RepID=A0A8S5NTV9_9CAUD|nr:MAG TPA: hypothetical protein [Myoviridae sp. ctkmZ20]